MNIFHLLPIRTLLVLTLFSTLLVTACSDNPASDDHDDHSDPEIMELVHDDEVIYEYSDITEEVTEHKHMHFLVGEEYLFEVHFLDENGDHVHAEDFEEGYSLKWDIENEDVLVIHQHEEDGRWEFHLEGLAEGGSKVQFLLDHGGDHDHLRTLATTEEDAIEFHIDADSDGEVEH